MTSGSSFRLRRKLEPVVAASVVSLHMRTVLITTAAILALTVLAGGGVLLIAPSLVWSWFGPADLGPVAFERLERRTTPNDALACPPGLCPARSDVVPPVFTVDAPALRKAMDAILATEPKLVRVDSGEAADIARYVQRSARLEFPDTIVVRYLDRPDGRSTLALYARSQIGRSDFGVNKARLERWLARLEAAVPAAR